ncbi:MAG: aminotransferase class I/II-fold pyridoxal phosphate-dependent enzyme [Polyangiales bacterium]
MAEKILIVGSSGLVGSALATAFRNDGIFVRGFDKSTPLSDGGLDDFVAGDVRDEALLTRLTADATAVVHLAAIVGVDAYLSQPDEVLDVNILGTRAVLLACEAHRVPVIVASTSEVYGRGGASLREDADSVYGPASLQRWCYATSKRAAEHYVYASASRGLRTAVVRFFNVYGAQLDPVGRERVVSRFVRALQRRDPLPLFDGGAEVRAFCYVDDAAAAVLRVVRATIAGDPAVCGQAFNIGRDEPVTIAELAGRFLRFAAQQNGVCHKEAAAHHGDGFDAVSWRSPDLAAIERATGWRSNTSLDEGVRLVLDAHGLLADHAPPPTEPRIPYVRPRFDADAALTATLRRSLDSGVVTNEGPEVGAFEAECAAWLASPLPLATSNGTTALTLAALALGIRGPVVMPSFTYVATEAALRLAGATPVYCDITRDRWTLDPDALEALLASRRDVRAVVAVNVYGVPPDLHRIAALCRRARVPLLYDDAHGFGTEVDGRRFTDEADVTVFSLHATKVMPAVEGGLAITADPALAREMRRLRRHGVADDILATTPGLNGRLDELRAAVGRHSLRGLEGALARRRAYADQLLATLARAASLFELQHTPDEVVSNHQNLAVLLRDASLVASGAVIGHFDALGIGTRRYFYPALHTLPGAVADRPLPVTERVAASVLCLPLHSRMDARTLARVEDAITRAAARFGASSWT